MFSGKVVLITGASSGIGAATAVHFAKENAKLSITDRNKENLEDVGKLCEEKNNQKPLIIPGDLTIDSDVKNILETTIKTYGKLDVLVNNAGCTGFTPIGELNMELYDKIFNTNARSVYLLTNLAAPHLIESQGNVVIISSVISCRTFDTLSAYAMSKAALDHFVRCAANELAPKKVRVNGVNPGAVPTNIQKSAGLDDEGVKHLMDTVATAHPLGRVGTVDEIAEAILFLASDKASFITGESLLVDGGLNVRSPVQF